jgi:hypothetical protein
MTNLLEETRAAIANSGHKETDVIWVGSADGAYRMDWTEFTSLADREYHSGYGAAEVATDLVVVFRDGAKLWRGEYDGSEWWEYDTPLGEITGTPKKIERVIGDYWPTVAGLHDPEKEGHQWHKEIED